MMHETKNRSTSCVRLTALGTAVTLAVIAAFALCAPPGVLNKEDFLKGAVLGPSADSAAARALSRDLFLDTVFIGVQAAFWFSIFNFERRKSTGFAFPVLTLGLLGCIIDLGENELYYGLIRTGTAGSPGLATLSSCLVGLSYAFLFLAITAMTVSLALHRENVWLTAVGVLAIPAGALNYFCGLDQRCCWGYFSYGWVVIWFLLVGCLLRESTDNTDE